MWFIPIGFWEGFRVGSAISLALISIALFSDISSFAETTGLTFNNEFWRAYWSHFMTDGFRLFILVWALFSALSIGIWAQYYSWLLGIENWFLRAFLLALAIPFGLILGPLTMFAGAIFAEDIWLMLTNFAPT